MDQINPMLYSTVYITLVNSLNSQINLIFYVSSIGSVVILRGIRVDNHDVNGLLAWITLITIKDKTAMGDMVQHLQSRPVPR